MEVSGVFSVQVLLAVPVCCVTHIGDDSHEVRIA
jgi:hypothetical protein